SRGCTISSGTRGDTAAHHGPLQRLLDGNPNATLPRQTNRQAHKRSHRGSQQYDRLHIKGVRGMLREQYRDEPNNWSQETRYETGGIQPPPPQPHANQNREEEYRDNGQIAIHG